MLRLSLLCIVCSLATACAPHQQRAKLLPTPPVFDANEHGSWVYSGATSLRGQAFLRQRGGGVVTCAGAPVQLFPDTPFMRALLQYVVDGGSLMDPTLDERALKLRRLGVCDAAGHFRIDDLPAADWIVVTEVAWQVGNRRQGGTLTKNASTRSASSSYVQLGPESLR